MSWRPAAIGAALALSVATRLGATPPDEGRRLYLRYCASCHGFNADGRGPVARALASPPADLRHLRTRYGTPLSAHGVDRFIDGRAEVTAHGERDMPVWGERFRDLPSEGADREAAVRARILAILDYLDSIQISASVP